MKNIHKIQWLNLPGYTGETWNPIVGCSKVSDGCKNCYAENMARRLAGIALKKDSTLSVAKYAIVINSGKWNGLTFFNQPELLIPAKWKSPRVVFVCSMGDLFFENHSFEHINAVFSVMADCDQCQDAGVPFFFKQWGEWKPFSTGDERQILPFGKYDPESKWGFIKTGKHKSGNTLDGVKYEEYPNTIKN